jgi:PilZ domain-containing protein
MEQRRAPRFVVEGIHGTMTSASQVEILNMSISGAAIRLDRNLRVGGEYSLRLELNDTVLAVKGLVVWSVLSEIQKGREDETKPFYSAGMKFKDILSQRLMELLEFIDRHKIVQENRLGGLRFHIDAPGKALLDVPQSYRVRIISLSGLLMDTDVPLELHQSYPMEMAIEGGDVIRFRGRVAYCSDPSEGSPKRYEIGVAFAEMTAADRARLGKFIETLSRKRQPPSPPPAKP